MSWSDRRGVLLSLAALAGCGFTPAYAPGGPGAALNNQVVVRPPEGFYEFDLGQHLENRLGPPAVAVYGLAFTLQTDSERVAITEEQDTNRFNIVGTASYRLYNLAGDQTVTRGSVSSFTSYSATGTTVATNAAERDAYRRLMVILGDKIILRLIAALDDTPA
ncbi:MAG: LPS assembly lipoprotein LptE [Pseudomonadota bacterium]